MASVKRDTPLINKAPRHRGHLTLMIIRRVGEVRSFKISPRILFWASLFFVLYIPTSVVVFNKYMQLNRENTTLLKQIEMLEEEVLNSEKILHRFQQHAALLEAYVHHLEEPQKARSAIPKAQISGEGSLSSAPEGLGNKREDGEKSSAGDMNRKFTLEESSSRMEDKIVTILKN